MDPSQINRHTYDTLHTDSYTTTSLPNVSVTTPTSKYTLRVPYLRHAGSLVPSALLLPLNTPAYEYS